MGCVDWNLTSLLVGFGSVSRIPNGMRGLKCPRLLVIGHYTLSRIPNGMRGLKCDWIDKARLLSSRSLPGRIPNGMRGLKFLFFYRITVIADVASLMGCVDWNSLTQFEQKGHVCVASLMGCVDWNINEVKSLPVCFCRIPNGMRGLKWVRYFRQA